MFIKIENWSENKPLIINTDNVNVITPYRGDAQMFQGMYEMIFDNEQRYLISEEQYQEFCEILSKIKL